MKFESATIQTKTAEQQFATLYKGVLTFESLDNIPKCDHSNDHTSILSIEIRFFVVIELGLNAYVTMGISAFQFEFLHTKREIFKTNNSTSLTVPTTSSSHTATSRHRPSCLINDCS